MKTFVALFAVVAAARAGLIAPAISSGSSVSSRAEDGLGNYKFAYDEKHATGGSFRSEAGNPWAVAGSYGLVDIDGRQRVVNYVADKLGFRASIKTNEPGTAPAAAAATSIATPGVAAVVKNIAAPVVAAASYGAPLLAAPLAGPVAPLGAAYSVGISHAAPVLAKPAYW